MQVKTKYAGSILPNATYGITLGANYKNFDLSIDGYGTSGAKVYNGKRHNVLQEKI
jgi:hypothetical protein